MHPTVSETIELLRKSLPVVFALSNVDQLTGGALKKRTLQNLKSAGEIPGECFLYDGKRKLIGVRDPLLDWWGDRLQPVESRIDPEAQK